VRREVRAIEVERGGGGDEQNKHRGGRGRVEEAEGIRTEEKGRRVWGGRVRATEIEKRRRGDEQNKHKGGRRRVEEAEGIRTKAKGRRVWGGRVSNRSRM
jgi:hypothetical protein